MMEDESSQNEDGKQMALKNLLFCDGEEPRVQHDDDSRVKLGENEGNTDSTSDNAKAHGSSPSRRSPDPNCAICLGTLENKSFTDSCFHTFCFTCLVEWSKVKAECPLCKQPFKSIVHNVRSIEDYDQYYISSRSADTSWRGADGRSFRYRSTVSSERWSARHRYATFEDSIEYRTHRMIYAPHSVTFPPVRNYIPESPSTSSFRRHIYESGLWVKPLGDGNAQRYRITSPEFYRQNPACTHRLTPWLNRELLALLHDSESQVTFVLELILALIMRYDIRSEEFYVHIEPYLQHRTSHFIHEFFNYAASLHDMRSYDNCAVYEKLEAISENSTNVMSSPGSDVVPLTTPSITISENSPPIIETVDSSDVPKRKTKKSSKRQPKLFLRRNQQSNIWQSVLPTYSRSLNSTPSGDSSDYAVSSSIQGFLDLGVVSGPSTSGLQATSHSKKTVGKSFSCVSDSSGSSSSDGDDECIIVDIVKPRALRTPEIVNLITSSEDERMIDSNGADDCCVTAEVGETTAQLSKRKEGEEEVAGKRGSKKKLKHHRKRSVNSSVLDDFSNCENLFTQLETPASPAPHEQGTSSSASICARTYTENDKSYNISKSQELPLGQDSLDSQLTESDKHISYSSSTTDYSQIACESERTNSTNKNFSVCSSGEDVPSSISSPSVTQTSNKMAEPVFSVVSIKQGSDFTFNCKSLSLTPNEENKSCEKWQHNSSNSSSSVEGSTTFQVSENKGKLRSVICRFSAAAAAAAAATGDKQNNRSDSSRHASSHSKKHKHKKKKKKHKHKHHKHSHSVSD